MKIKELAILDRPYEKLLNIGVYNLTDSELLSIIIKSGTSKCSALDIAKEIMSKDKESIGLYFLNQYSLEELMKINGIGKTKAIQIIALLEICKRYNARTPIQGEVINTPEQLSMIFKNDLQDKKQEILKTALFDTKNRLIKVVTNSIGTINSNTIDMREILVEPIKCSAVRIAVAHNHPSGDSTPSNQDIRFTEKLFKACSIFGISLLDHIIIGSENYSSFKKLGLL